MKTTTLITFTFCFIQLFCVDTQGILTQKPREEVFGILNNRVELNCSTDLNRPINWEFSSYGTTRYSWIYLNSLMTQAQEARYKIESSNGNYRLIIESLDWSYAGKYKCTDDAGLGQSVIAQLTVIDPKPRCFHYPSSGQPTRPPCSSGAMLCSFYYLGDATPMWNLSKYVVERNTTAVYSTTEHHKIAKTFNITVNQSCENITQATDMMNISTSDKCYACVWCCLADGTTFGVAVSLAVLGLGTSIVLSVYIVHLKRIITNLKVGNDGSATAHHSSGITPTENSRYELVEGDFIDASVGAIHDGDYDALGQHGSYKPSLYDRLRVSKQSTNRGKILPFPKEEEESQASAGASCDPNTTEEVSRRRSQGKDSYLILVQ